MFCTISNPHYILQNSTSIAGQWFGYFSYGPDYGPDLEGEKVTFSFLIEELHSGQFKGKCIELKGIGSSEEVSIIQGFTENGFISFTKEYQLYTTFDEHGNELPYGGSLAPRLSYKGNYNQFNNTYNGTWEMCANEIPFGDGTFVDLATGLWEMGRDSATYGA